MGKKFEDLTFGDDWMFQAVLRDPEISAELVELLLGIKVRRVEYPELEKVIEPFYSTKGVRLDVYLKDEDKVIDVELQSYEMAALGKRMRYYEALLDMDALMKGEPYDKLKDSYILFICKNDPFKDKNGMAFDLPRYSFRNVCQENNSVNLDDKSLKVIYNATAYEKEKDERVKALLRFVQTNESGEDGLTNRLAALVKKMKKNEQLRQEYMAMNLHDYDMIRKGRKEGALEKAVEDATNLIKMRVGTLEQIEQATGVPMEELQRIATATALPSA
jgi:predicted transposase/invertase (TIGR01784 family)